MSTEATIYFFKPGQVQREETRGYSAEWLAACHEMPNNLQQHDAPFGEALSYVQMFDVNWVYEPFTDSTRWQNIISNATTKLRNLSGLLITDELIEQVLELYAVISITICDAMDPLKLGDLLEKHLGHEFFISVD